MNIALYTTNWWPKFAEGDSQAVLSDDDFQLGIPDALKCAKSLENDLVALHVWGQHLKLHSIRVFGSSIICNRRARADTTKSTTQQAKYM